MNIEEVLSQRIGKLEIIQIAHFAGQHPVEREQLFQLTRNENQVVSWHAWWACEHLSRENAEWLAGKYDEIVDFVLSCNHSGKKRLALNILLHLPTPKSISTPLLNFCLDTIQKPEEAPAIIAVCMKLAYALCLEEMELLNELSMYLTHIETDFYSPAVKSTQKNVLKAIHQKKKKRRL